jgi:hypothetical protein
MIVSRRFFSWNDVVIKRWLIRHPSFLIKVVGSRGVCSEDRLWERAKLWAVVPDWPCVGLPLRGHGVMRAGDAAMPMQRGFLGWVRRGSDFRARTEPTDGFAVFVQWDPNVFGEGSEVPIARERIDPRDLERFSTIASAISAPDATHATIAANISEMFQLLGARGMFNSRPPMADLLRTPPPRLLHVGTAIDTVLSRSGSRPMVVDLSGALGCSERQARYLVREYADAYALQGAREWRTLVNVWTTYLAGLLMTAKNATTERVAALLGYGSPNALCHALTNAGLPSPGEMRRIVHELA